MTYNKTLLRLLLEEHDAALDVIKLDEGCGEHWSCPDCDGTWEYIFIEEQNPNPKPTKPPCPWAVRPGKCQPEVASLVLKEAHNKVRAFLRSDGTNGSEGPEGWDWEYLPDKTTNSGKMLFRCNRCGLESPCPDKWEYHGPFCKPEGE